MQILMKFLFVVKVLLMKTSRGEIHKIDFRPMLIKITIGEAKMHFISNSSEFVASTG